MQFIYNVCFAKCQGKQAADGNPAFSLVSRVTRGIVYLPESHPFTHNVYAEH